MILPANFPGAKVSKTAEHDVRFDEELNRWVKYTIPQCTGLTVDWDGVEEPLLRMATPLEYLKRIHLQNVFFGDTIRLLGLWYDQAGGGWRVVISQADIVGVPPSRIQILEGMRDLGFLPLGIPGPNRAPAFRRDNVIVWDGHPGNLVWTIGDVLVPIDLIITEFKGN